MRRRVKSPNLPPRLLEQVERARQSRAVAHAMYLRCREEMERLRERMSEVRESGLHPRVSRGSTPRAF